MNSDLEGMGTGVPVWRHPPVLRTGARTYARRISHPSTVTMVSKAGRAWGDKPTGTETEKSRIRFKELLTAQRTQPNKCAGDLQEAEKNHLGGQPFIYNMCYLQLKILSHSATPHPSLKI